MQNNRLYPQDLVIEIDKAKEKGNLPVLQLVKDVKALCAQGVRDLLAVLLAACVRARP